MHIELTEMLRCPEPHREEPLVLSTGEMLGRMVRSGLIGCPVCRREYPVVKGVVDFTGGLVTGEGGRVSPAATRPSSPASRSDDAQTLQALLDLGGPGGFVALLGSAARFAVSLSALIGGVHFVGVNPPAGIEELPVLSLLRATDSIPLRRAMVRGVLVGRELATAPWLAEAVRVLLQGRRMVVEGDQVAVPDGVKRLASGDGLFVGAKA